MAKVKKVAEENIEQPDVIQEQPEITNDDVSENKEEEIIPETQVSEVINIPDIPAQMDNSVPDEPKGETEIEFLYRILHIQEDGGFGRHLNGIINERIKSLS